MSKYCPICGMENLKEAGFCSNCGANFGMNTQTNNAPFQPETNNGMMSQYYGQTQQYTPQKSPNKIKPIIAIVAAIAIAAILIVVLMSGGIFDKAFESEQDINKISVSGGPSANLESMVTGGNALTTPAIGHTAVYGYYASGYKIGDISFTAAGEETYNGEQCYRVYGDGYLNFDAYGQSIGTNFDLDAYITKADSILAHSTYNFNFYEPYSMDMEMTMDVDKDNGEIRMSVYNTYTGSVSTVIEVSDEYWDISLIEDNLYVGYTDEITYTTSMSGVETEISLKISVVNQEDITVPKGTFENCYSVKIEQTESLTSTTTYSMLWIDENNVCPKMKFGDGTSSLGYEGDMTIELEEYYTT